MQKLLLTIDKVSTFVGQFFSWLIVALTLLIFYLYGYTLNRITVFAQIFSIGVLVDDAIVVVENIVRHYRMPVGERRPPLEAAIHATPETNYEKFVQGRAQELLTLLKRDDSDAFDAKLRIFQGYP